MMDGARVQSPSLTHFARVMNTGCDSGYPGPAASEAVTVLRQPRINLDEDNVKNGLGRLVLTLVKLLHELLERQAIRRIDAGYLSDAEMERLGLALMKQTQEIERLRQEFNLDEEDLNLDLGPLGKLL
jgi:hypothetical protein